jgi:hypothetical protein
MNASSLDLSRLPRFPCHADNKKPLTSHGFKDAVRVRDDSAWPLVGVPTGVKFDVVDVDPRNGGTAWYDQNFDALPLTRSHATRDGGIHLLFRAAPGLRCTSGRIAAGVDVKAKGGYVIWWPREGLPFEDAPLCEWPDWLLAEAMRPKAREVGKGVAAVNKDRHLSPSIHGNGNVGDLTAALWKLDPTDYRGHDRWLRLMMSCHAAGIERQAFIEWSTSDPDYANDADVIARRWDSLRADGGVSIAALLAEVRRTEARNGQAGEGGGPFSLSLPSKTHSLPLPSNPQPKRNTQSSGRNLKARLDCLLREVERTQGANRESMLFWAACVMAEIIAEDSRLTSSVAMALLISAAHVNGLWREIGAEECRRTISNGLRHVEMKLLQEDQPTTNTAVSTTVLRKERPMTEIRYHGKSPEQRPLKREL